MEKSDVLKKIRQLVSNYEKGLIPTLTQHEVHPELAKSSRENYVYFTLPVSINYQRSSPAMWQSAFETYNDPLTNYLFFPEKVIAAGYDKVLEDLPKHKLALQRNRHSQIWYKLSETFVNDYEADPRKLIKAGESSVKNIKEILQIKSKKDFPYLSGDKMANYWLYILHQYTDIKLKDLDSISIIPDTHVIQSSKKLGIIDADIPRAELAEMWNLLLTDSGFIPMQLHPVLWNWSRNNFLPEV